MCRPKGRVPRVDRLLHDLDGKFKAVLAGRAGGGVLSVVATGMVTKAVEERACVLSAICGYFRQPRRHQQHARDTRYIYNNTMRNIWGNNSSHLLGC